MNLNIQINDTQDEVKFELSSYKNNAVIAIPLHHKDVDNDNLKKFIKNEYFMQDDVSHEYNAIKSMLEDIMIFARQFNKTFN